MRLGRLNPGFINLTADVAISKAIHDGKTLLLDALAGLTATLPAATGADARYRFVVKTLATSNSYIIKVNNATDVMRGIVSCLDSNLATVNQFGFVAATTADTVTLDRTNTGSVTVGEWIEFRDYASGLWLVAGQLSGAAPATPFSATVS